MEDLSWIEEVNKRALLQKPPVLGGRSNKCGEIDFKDLVFVPAQLARRPVDYFREKIDAKTVIGKTSKRPLVLETPIMIAAMSFGALSKEAKIALAKAGNMAGTSTNTGEGGMLPEERQNARLLIAQYSTARFGVDEAYIRSADAIEIKIGQGAKPGQGGLLPKEKVTPEIASVRKIDRIEDLHSPPCHPDIHSVQDLRNKVEWLRKDTGGKPIIIKLGAGDIERDVPMAVRANPDVIAIDGMEGGTGAAPEIMLNDFGIPTVAALAKARKVMDRMHARQQLIVGGGLNTGMDMAKALAMGADAVFLGFSLLVAMGCVYCRQCYRGVCPKGITSQNPKLRRRLNVDRAAVSIANFIRTCTEEMKMAAAATGKRSVHDMNRNDLLALNPAISQITGIKLV
jgi:glutamate synthase domain-containing protein 2